jgi:uncharacterized LabA/DUF88 family protein
MNCYFFVDGAALLGDIQRVKREFGIPEPFRFDLVRMVQFFTGPRFHAWTGASYRRFVFYFVQRDERLERLVALPDATIPGLMSDMRIEYCGKRIAQFAAAQEWLERNNAPPNVRECLYRSEKAVDTQICCDALQLAGTGKLDRLFLYTNDFDFVPLCRALRQLGANVNLIRLSERNTNTELAPEFDAFHIMDEATIRWALVDPNPVPPPPPVEAAAPLHQAS